MYLPQSVNVSCLRKRGIRQTQEISGTPADPEELTDTAVCSLYTLGWKQVIS